MHNIRGYAPSKFLMIFNVIIIPKIFSFFYFISLSENHIIKIILSSPDIVTMMFSSCTNSSWYTTFLSPTRIMSGK